MARDPRGSATPMMVVAALAAGALAMAVTRMGAVAVDRARARTAADATALAAAAENREAAAGVAEANGGHLVDYTEIGADRRVTVSVGRAEAIGRAHSDPPPAPETGTRAGLAPAMRAVLARADQLLGHPVPVAVGKRSPGSTEEGPPDPGMAGHVQGLAVDVVPGSQEEVAAVAARAGLCRTYPGEHPEHFEVCHSG